MVTPDKRPPHAYLHGPSVIVPAKVAAWMHDQGLGLLRIDPQSLDPQVLSVLVALRQAALDWRQLPQQAEELPSDVDRAELLQPTSARVGCAQAAGLLGITPRAVRLAIHEQRLHAEQVGSTWQIDLEDLNRFRTSRRRTA